LSSNCDIHVVEFLEDLKMDEDFDYNDAEDLRFSVERYEEMIRNKDQYFFDAQSFEGIIDYFIENEYVTTEMLITSA
jgi:hypothetical protein